MAGVIATPKTTTWQDWHEINPSLFPLPLELREIHSGSIGVLLRNIPLELVRDANRCPNPWQDLASMEFIPAYRSLFLSCASVLPAWELLAGFGWGGATGAKQSSRLSERMEEARRRGDKAEALRIERKIVDAMLRYDPEPAKKIAINIGDENLMAFQELNIKSRERNRRPVQPNSKESAKARLVAQYQIQILLVSNWIRSGSSGDPGWLFYTHPALASLFSAFDFPISSEAIEQKCVRLGLRKPDAGFLVFSNAIKDAESGIIRLNHLPPKMARQEFPKDAWKLRSPIKVGHRTFYAGISTAPMQPISAKVVGM